MKARIHITLKPGVLDPQGEAVRHALTALGFAGVTKVRQGKVIDIELAETDPDRAQDRIARMCEQLLANTVIEDWDVEFPE